MRLDKYLAETGAGTRREVKKIIAAGRITVNDMPARDPAARIAEETDVVCLDGETVRYAAFEYFMLNKPRGVVSASRSTDGEVCVTDLIHEKIRQDLFPAGRLDKDTEGLMLITNDGQLSHRLLSPAHHVDKVYEVQLDGVLSEAAARRLMAGVDIGDEKPTLPCSIEMLSASSCRITIREGRYHQIKRMFASEGLAVTALRRLSMGTLVLDPALGPGEYRPLTAEETDALRHF